ncbi:hypothetical protein GCM10010182_00850 [Actinomadura cremea]|nr:hypothetical protein GCM10010182_00850 [Actinomadura cremea]
MANAVIICCVLIITIPFGIASFRIANYALWPFSRTLVRRTDAGAASTIGNVIWVIFARWWLALGVLGHDLDDSRVMGGLPPRAEWGRLVL